MGFVSGFAIAHAPGALIGLIFGHFFDRLANPPLKQKAYVKYAAKTNATVSNSAESNATAYLIYVDTLFSILGHVAYVREHTLSGQTSTIYLNKLHNIMQQMALNEAVQCRAWDCFKQGEHSNFNLKQALFSFSHHCGHHTALSQQLLQQMVDMASTQQPLTMAQYALLCEVAHALHISTTTFAHLIPKAQHRHKPADDTLIKDYKTLGIAASASTAQVKWAYRKLMGRYHPDRLISKELPDEFIELATQRTQEIKAAYEKICKARGI